MLQTKTKGRDLKRDSSLRKEKRKKKKKELETKQEAYRANPNECYKRYRGMNNNEGVGDPCTWLKC